MRGEAFVLGTIASSGDGRAAVIAGERVYPLPGGPDMAEVLADWAGRLTRIEAELGAGALGSGIPLSEIRLGPPVPEPRNLYMAGANFADHAREMRGLPPDAPVEPHPLGPFVFLKPTTTIIGPGDPIVLPAGATRVDWEIELAAVIGAPMRAATRKTALSCVAGYTIINDISVRDWFKRDDSEPSMTWDWFLQKGWATSCPMGPWLVPAAACPDPGKLRMTLEVNGIVEQESSTGQMLHSLEEQIVHVSRVVELRPGDVISTGTPAGVGAGKGRFLEPGDLVAAEIEGIGRLENHVVSEGPALGRPANPTADARS
jgi:2,4-didehydro-3-deoxy-L-rhamnonate hydrolase